MTHTDLAGVLLAMSEEAQRRADMPVCKDHRGMLLQIKFIMMAGAQHCIDKTSQELRERL